MSSKKQIFKINTLKKLQSDENSCVSLVPTTRLLALPPFFLNDMKSGILYQLNNMLKKYDRALGGIIIGYQNIKVLMDENTGIIPIGTSETEVNISVEFYIFQPKIGSFLEGVVNKKSNSHIGCLVHRYFNATILKPDDVDYEDWVCHDFNVDDKIIFKVKNLDFTSLLPLIEGIIDDEGSLDKVEKNFNGSCDIAIDIVNNVNKSCLNKVSLSEEFSESEEKNKIRGSVIKNSLEFDSFPESKLNKKKKKKREKEGKELLKASNNHNQTKGKGLDDIKELTSDTMNKEPNLDGTYFAKKKKKKKKNKETHEDEFVKNTHGSSTGGENVTKKEASEKLPIETEDFVKSIKSESEVEEPFVKLNEANRCFFTNEAEDEIFYSTQLDSSHPEKMNLCFSPIFKDEKEDLDAKKKKQKQKKRKKEGEESVDVFNPKRLKSSHSDKSDKSGLQIMMEELCKEKFDTVKDSFDKESSKERKKKMNKSQLNGGNEQKSETHSLVDELLKQEMQKVKEKLNISDGFKEKTKRSKKRKTKESDSESTKTQLNGERKYSVRDIMDQLLKEEMNRIKEHKKLERKEEKKKKKETHNSLYEKLLKDAKSAMNLEENKCSNSKEFGKKKKKKRNDLSVSSTSSFSSHKTKSYKNGSMYDMTLTPEKVINFDKSLFSDSDQSPVKKSESERKKEKRSKSEQKSDTKSSSQQNESLYEKLLREAKSLINRNDNQIKKEKNI